MGHQATIHSTFVLSRTYPKPHERVFGALADSARKRRWFAEGEHHDVEEFEMNFRVGGVERLRYRMKEGTPFPGVVVANEGTFLDIVPDRRVVLSQWMTFGDRRISASLITFELEPDGDGTKLVCTFQGAYFEGSDGPRVREMGWKALLDRLGGEVSR
jgi:uncharacterized protein YndB with AHSA1/START domain